MFLIQQDLEQLAGIREYDDYDVHFTERYPESWLDRMEDADLIQIWKPLDDCTSDCPPWQWRLRLTAAGRKFIRSC